jgi:hypothetical protein
MNRIVCTDSTSVQQFFSYCDDYGEAMMQQKCGIDSLNPASPHTPMLLMFLY